MSTVKELIVHHLIYTFEKEAWQWPLSFAVAGLTAEQAAWKPGPERHSIWQIVRHVIRWKEGVQAALEGRPPAYEEISEGDWQEAGGDEAAWEREVDRLRRVSLEFKAHAEAMHEGELSRDLSWYAGVPARPIDQRLLDMATHDIYHAGQIQYIRALQEIPSDMFYNAVADGGVPKARRILETHPELLNAYGRDGSTGLQLAAWFGHRAMVEFLLDRGADLDAVSQNEMRASALRSAEAGKHVEIVELLRSRGATR